MEEIIDEVEKRKHAKNPFKNNFIDLITSDFQSNSIYEAGYELDVNFFLNFILISKDSFVNLFYF